MAVEIKIQISGDKIVVDAPQKEYHHEFKNTLARIPSGAVIAIGQSLADLVKENPHNEEKFRAEVEFAPIYNASPKGLETLLFFLEFLATKLRRGRGLYARFLDSEALVYDLDLPAYESIDETARKQFEFSLTKFVVRGLTINAEVRGWEKWQRQVLEISRPAFLLAWPFLWYLFVLIVAPLAAGLGFGGWLIYLAGLLAIYYFVILLRVLVLKSFLPRDLLRSEMLSPRLGMGKFGVYVAGKFLT